MPQSVYSPGATLACNMAARKLGEYLAGHEAAEIAGWVIDDRDMAQDLPADFELPGGIKGRVTTAAIRGLGQRTPDGRCPTWDLILRIMHDAAGTALASASGYRDPRYDPDVLALTRVRTIAALLARDDVRTWYYRQMDALREQLLAAVGRKAASTVGGEAEPEEGEEFDG